MMLTSYIDKVLMPRSRKSTYPSASIPVPVYTRNITSTPNKPVSHQQDEPAEPIRQTKRDGSAITEPLRSLEKLLSQGVIHVDTQAVENWFKYCPGTARIRTKSGYELPEQFAKDLGRSRLSITFNNQRHEIASLGQFLTLSNILPPQYRAAMEIVTALCDQSWFADNAIALIQALPATVNAFNSDKYRIDVSLTERPEEGGLTQEVRIRGEVGYTLTTETAQGESEKIANLRVTGVVEKAFQYFAVAGPDDNRNSPLSSRFNIDFIPDEGCNALVFERVKRDRAITLPALRPSEKNCAVKTASDTDDFHSQASWQGSQSSGGRSFFSRLKEAWNAITERVFSVIIRIGHFFGF